MAKIIPVILSLLLMTSMALTTDTPVLPTEMAVTDVVTTVPESVWDENEETILLTNGAVYGEGEKSFTFAVSSMGSDVAVTVNTDAETVGEALVALDMIAGDESEWGLYVKTVNGVTADYNVDGSYWAFYIDGEYAMTGVDATEITDGATYAFVVEGLDYAEEVPAAEEEGDTITLTDGATYGEGAVSFTFSVVDAEQNTVTVTVNTDAATVGEALVELNMIAGEDSDWGLYVMTVNNVTADYNVDGHYWAFYIDGEYAMTGVDSTEVTAGATYTFAVE